METDPETRYRQIGRLIEVMPDLTQWPLPSDVRLWLARANALVQEAGCISDRAFFMSAMDDLGSTNRYDVGNRIQSILYRVFAIAERMAPAGVGGAFIPVGNRFDAFAALSKVLQTATKNVMIVDPYMDETALTEFCKAVPENVFIYLLADQVDCKPTLQPAAEKWVQQYGVIRPLSARLAPKKTLHDRAIFIDQTTAWILTQSLKDFAKRAPAEIVRADDTAALKIAAYQNIWDSAEIII